MSTTLSTQIADDLINVLYPDTTDEEKAGLAQVHQTIVSVLVKHNVDRPAAPAGNDANVINLLRQMMAGGGGGATTGGNSGSGKTKGPKKGTVNCYHVYLKDYCDYPQWKSENPGKSYQDFQKAMSPSWEEFKKDETKLNELKAKAAERTAAK